MQKVKNKRSKRDDTAAIIAQIHGVSARYVRMVRAGDRKNEEILASLVDFQVGKRVLIQSIEKVVPTPVISTRHGRKKN